jgi:hypothetical protein
MQISISHRMIRHLIVFSLLAFLCSAAPSYWRRARADSAPPATFRGEAAVAHLKERGLYTSLSKAVSAAQAVQTGIAPQIAENAQLTAGDGVAEDFFGTAVAISGDTAIVGAPRNDIGANADQGAAYIFVKSGGVWTQQDKLTAATGAAGDFYGGAVAISGDTAIVGACFNDVGGNANQGSVYVYTRSAGVWTQQDKLTAGDGAADDLFGFSVALDGDTVMIGAHLADGSAGANQGAAYVFTRSAGVWSQSQKLSAPDPEGGATFGVSVALDAGTAVIGASGKTERGNASAGAAYAFTRSSGTWTAQQKLLPDISAVDNFFGAAVAVSGETALVGAFGDDIDVNANQGAAVVFTRSAGVWTKQERLTAADGSAEDKFGFSVALSGDIAVIGVIGDDLSGENQGSAYVFARSGAAWSQQSRLFAAEGEAGDTFGAPVAVSGDAFLIGASFDDVDGNANQGMASIFMICQGLAEQQKLTASNGGVTDSFGYSVAVSGDTAVVGSPFNNVGGNVDQGSAYVFVRNGAAWTQQQILTVANGAASDFFGVSVSVSGDTVAVGAYQDDVGANADQGSVYIFTRSGTTWTQQQRLDASDGAASDDFGQSVAVSGDIVVIGAPEDDIGGNIAQGSAYIFTRTGGVWTEQTKLIAGDAAQSDRFGIAVAISGDTVVIGSPFNDISGNSAQGSAYVFTLSGATWTQQEKLTASAGAAYDEFGHSVAISGDTAVVGAYLNDVGGNLRQGSAHVFTRSGSAWSEQQKLTAQDGATNDIFGASVAVSGDTVVVGAPGDDINGRIEQGSAYVYVRNAETWTQRQKLTASDGGILELLGEAVAVSGDTAMVGAAFDTIDGNPRQGSAYIFACAACSAITLDPPSLPGGVTGDPYLWNITATGGVEPYNYSVSSGSLPAGLTFDPATGAISGTPTSAGTFQFTITATGPGLCPGSRDYALVIACRTINVSPANPNLPTGEVNAAYSRAFTASGGLAPYSFSIGAGALPGGLSLNPATGVLSGAPTSPGVFNFQVTANDSAGCAGSTAYVLTVNCPTIAIAPANAEIPNLTVGSPFNQALTATGGVGPYTFDVALGALPGGLSLNATTGVLSGTPTARNTFNFIIRATDSNGCDGRRPYRIVVN